MKLLYHQTCVQWLLLCFPAAATTVPVLAPAIPATLQPFQRPIKIPQAKSACAAPRLADGGRARVASGELLEQGGLQFAPIIHDVEEVVALDAQVTRNAITNFLTMQPESIAWRYQTIAQMAHKAWYASNERKSVLNMVLSDGASTIWAGGVQGIVHELQGMYNDSYSHGTCGSIVVKQPSSSLPLSMWPCAPI